MYRFTEFAARVLKMDRYLMVLCIFKDAMELIVYTWTLCFQDAINLNTLTVLIGATGSDEVWHQWKVIGYKDRNCSFSKVNV